MTVAALTGCERIDAACAAGPREDCTCQEAGSSIQGVSELAVRGRRVKWVVCLVWASLAVQLRSRFRASADGVAGSAR
jgi:hypothetical protein